MSDVDILCACVCVCVCVCVCGKTCTHSVSACLLLSQTKSTYTLDVHSEYGGMSMVLPGTFHYSDEISG